MIDDIFVFDNVIHLYDLSEANIRRDRADARPVLEQTLAEVKDLRWKGYPLHDDAQFDWGRRWNVDDMYDLVFRQAPTDMAMAQVVPMFDWFTDWYAPVTTQHQMAATYPDRVLFCGGVDPMLRGLNDALNQLDYQVNELGARSLKFYNGHAKNGDCWRCDDERFAYPMYERARDAGVRVLQFHKGNPHGLQNVEFLSPLDLQAPARDFPDMDFIVHHLALPYFDEMVSLAARFPNVYMSLAGYMAFYRIAPRRVQHHLGRLLQVGGADKILWGSEAALAGCPAPYLRAFMDFEIPDDMRAGYGYPQITRDDKKKILGENFARLMGIDIEQKKAEFAGKAQCSESTVATL
ncbi:amidohydrolase family protein [Paraburkholderia sediminicola]|uniref:amidohydrolase family protein n=1 Tax=Paraburkholderia sediminicola TaxID=458836 RepID=UPI0038B6C8D0